MKKKVDRFGGFFFNLKKIFFLKIIPNRNLLLISKFMASVIYGKESFLVHEIISFILVAEFEQ